jgi:GNAT superfamily N-acetyltransferase
MSKQAQPKPRNPTQLEIKIYPCQEQGFVFYGHLGKFFAFKHYGEEGGSRHYNLPNSVWFLAFINAQLAGFCASFLKRTHILWDNHYVLAEYRRQGISKALLQAQLTHSLPYQQPIRSMSLNPIHQASLLKLGFTETGQRGRFTNYELAVDGNRT